MYRGDFHTSKTHLDLLQLCLHGGRNAPALGVALHSSVKAQLRRRSPAVRGRSRSATAAAAAPAVGLGLHGTRRRGPAALPLPVLWRRLHRRMAASAPRHPAVGQPAVMAAARRSAVAAAGV